MEFIDTHTHLFAEDFNEDRFQVIERAIEAGIKKMLLPNIDRDTIEPMLELCAAFPVNCFPMIGLHPTSVKEDYKEHLKDVEKYLQSHKFCAIGEVGIDLYWDKSYFAMQSEAFIYQIELSRKHRLPLVIHSRDSHNEIIEILHKQYDKQLYTGVFHSFTGTMDQAKEVIDMGFKIGINGVVTFKNTKLDDVIKNIDLRNIVLETDSPYLTPVPYRGKRNESSYLFNIVNKIADIKQISPDVVGEITTLTANSVFNLG
jgi:TatD DNase family protein